MDLHNNDKIDNFIVTKTATDLMGEFIDNIESDNAKPQLFIGPYGKGKSHLLLVLAELLYVKDLNNHKNLEENLVKTNPDFSEKIKKKNGKRYLPIVLTGSYEAFKTELIIEIKKRLNDEEIDNFDIQTAYEQALKLISNWTYDKNAEVRLAEYCKNKKITMSKVSKGLEEFKVKDLKIFKDIYTYMMYGQKFEPLINENITNIIREISSYLKENTDFDGLLLIMDEFSKLLEGNAAAETYSDIQNLAELTGNSSFRLICVAHKRIGAYTNHLSNEKRNEWKKIEGRFDQLFFGMFEDQSYYYKLIEKAVSKKNINEKHLIDKARDIYFSFSYAYNSTSIDEKLIVEGAFPLNPYTAYCLIKLSEKVGQNERSLFIFLCGEQNYGLRKLVDRNDTDLKSVDVLYDYFSNTIEGNKNTKAYKTYVKAETIIENLDNVNEIKIIKALAIFYMIDDTKTLVPKSEYISRALNNIAVEDEIKNLINRGLLLVKVQSKQLSFIAGTGSNVQKDIDKIIDLNYKHMGFGEIYNQVLNNNYIIPKRYNYDNAITRFFKVKFIDSELFCEEGFNLMKYLNVEFSDGYIVYVICKNEEDIASTRLVINKINLENVICTISNNMNKIQELMLNLLAITAMINNKKKYSYDDFVTTELKLLKSEYEYNLDEYFDGVTIGNQKLEGYYLGKKIENYEGTREFNNFLSKICQQIFCYYPRMNYELVNKNKISAQAKNARRYTVEKLFDPEIEHNNLRDTSAEKTMYRVLAEHTLINTIDQINFVTIDNEETNNYNRVFNEIHQYFMNANEKSKISDLYLILQSAPYGLRKGVIPIFLSKYLSNYKKNAVVVMDNREVSLTMNNLEFIDDHPENFTLYISHETKETEEYLNRVNKLYMTNKIYRDLNIYDETFRRIEEYVKKLPSCAKNLSYVFYDYDYIPLPKAMRQLKKEFLGFNANAKEVLTNRVPRKIYKGESYEKIENEFIRMKEIYDSYIENIKKYLIHHVKDVLGYDENIDLRIVLIKWRKSMKYEKLKYVDNSKFVKLSGYANKHLKDKEFSIIEDIAYIVTGVVIEDWNDKSFEIFKQSIASIIETYNSLENVDNDTKNKTKLILKSPKFNIERYFTYVDTSDAVEC